MEFPFFFKKNGNYKKFPVFLPDCMDPFWSVKLEEVSDDNQEEPLDLSITSTTFPKQVGNVFEVRM